MNRLDAPSRSVVGRLTAIMLTFLTGKSHSVTEIARLTGLPVSTTHRLAAELASWQLLRRESGGKYEIGPNVQRIAGGVDSRPSLFDRAPLVVTDLSDATRRRARLGVLHDGRVAYFEKRAGSQPPSPFCTRATLPAHATAVGKALLAFAPEATLAAVESRMTTFTPSTHADPEGLRRELRRIRLSGIAMARGELARGDVAMAAPVFGCGGVVVAALELQVDDVLADLALSRAALLVATRSLSRELSLTGFAVDRPLLRLLPARRSITPSRR